MKDEPLAQSIKIGRIDAERRVARAPEAVLLFPICNISQLSHSEWRATRVNMNEVMFKHSQWDGLQPLGRPHLNRQ